MAILRIKLADQSEITHELSADRITIGRRPDNLIQIIDRSVSAHHAELISENGHYRLHDLGSTNLSFVNGQPVTDFHLHHACRIAFGTVQCEFDPAGDRGEVKLSTAQLEKDLAFLRGENADLQGKIHTLERQIDILSSARLVTKKADTTPFAAGNDTLKTIAAERDDLRHLTTGLKLELEKLRGELEAMARERDAARQALELLQAEKVMHARELQDLRKQAAGPSADRQGGEQPSAGPTVLESPTVVLTPIPQNGVATSPASSFAQPTATLTTSPGMAMADAAPRLPLLPPPEFQPLANSVLAVRTAIEKVAADPNALPTLAQAIDVMTEAASRLNEHPISRLTLALQALLQDILDRPEPPDTTLVRTVSQATELIARLLEPRCLERARNLAHPRVLAVDDDTDLLHTLAASLELAQLPTTTCPDSRKAHAILEKHDYDLLLLDVNLPGLDGPALCSRIREIERHRKTPVIFLTVANTLDHRAQASLSGGNDFLPKPFNTAELTVKAETWIWKNRFGLL